MVWCFIKRFYGLLLWEELLQLHCNADGIHKYNEKQYLLKKAIKSESVKPIIVYGVSSISKKRQYAPDNVGKCKKKVITMIKEKKTETKQEIKWQQKHTRTLTCKLIWARIDFSYMARALACSPIRHTRCEFAVCAVRNRKS